MRSTVRRMVRVQLRLAVAGAVVLAALTAATAGASAATTRGRTGGETAPRTRSPASGFLLAKGVGGPFTPVDVPGAPRNLVRGLNDRGQLVGSYENTVSV